MVSARITQFVFFAVLSIVCGVQQKNFNSPDISAVVINLATRRDRYSSFLESQRQTAPWLQVTRIDAVDGAKSPPSRAEVTDEWDNSHVRASTGGIQAGITNMSDGERGCAASHVKAWRRITLEDHPVIVFEDDVEIHSSFKENIIQVMKEAPNDTDLISLVASDRRKDLRKPFSQTLMRPYMMLRTNGYILYPKGAKKLLTMLPVNAPSDDFLAWHIRNGDLNGFSVKEALVNSDHEDGDIEHSLR